jgi:hypothetical protein
MLPYIYTACLAYMKFWTNKVQNMRYIIDISLFLPKVILQCLVVDVITETTQNENWAQ